MGNQGSEAPLLQKRNGPGGILGIFLFGPAAPGIAGKEGEGVRPNGGCGLHHGGEASGGGKMAAQIHRKITPVVFFPPMLSHPAGKSKLTFPKL